MEQLKMIREEDTIAAISTPAGTGGIAVIRVSGPSAMALVDKAWKGKPLSGAVSHTAHLGKYYNTSGDLLDECIATVYKAPNTFTGEDVVELSVHGSKWIQREILTDLIRRGARSAEPGEFTRRAFMNGRLDLAQAEGIADLIAASSKAAHTLAISQTKGKFSRELDNLREKLIDFASLLELELDFSEEDVEFADRMKLLDLSREILKKVERLSSSYSSGAVLKEGVPVVIAGIPNAGKSSLLNLLLNDDKAIVSDVPGTTRDSIEDTIEIEGILYRFIDTAGLRKSSDTVEKIGIERARNLMKKARIVIWIIDPTAPLSPQREELTEFLRENPETRLILLQNKSDILNTETETKLQSKSDLKNTATGTYLQNKSDLINTETGTKLQSKSDGINTETGTNIEIIGRGNIPVIPFSTKTGEGLDKLIDRLKELTTGEYNPETELIVTNARHYEALIRGGEALKRAIEGIEEGISGDFIAQDVREALHHIGTITGAITTPTLLQTIFSRFCIGK